MLKPAIHAVMLHRVTFGVDLLVFQRKVTHTHRIPSCSRVTAIRSNSNGLHFQIKGEHKSFKQEAGEPCSIHFQSSLLLNYGIRVCFNAFTAVSVHPKQINFYLNQTTVFAAPSVLTPSSLQCLSFKT